MQACGVQCGVDRVHSLQEWVRAISGLLSLPDFRFQMNSRFRRFSGSNSGRNGLECERFGALQAVWYVLTVAATTQGWAWWSGFGVGGDSEAERSLM